MPTFTISCTTPADLAAQLRSWLAALEPAPVEVKTAQPEGEFPECDDIYLPLALRYAINRPPEDITIEGIQKTQNLSWGRSNTLYRMIKKYTKNFDSFLIGQWLDQLGGK